MRGVARRRTGGCGHNAVTHTILGLYVCFVIGANTGVMSLAVRRPRAVSVIQCRHGRILKGIAAGTRMRGVARRRTGGCGHGRGGLVCRVILFLIAMCAGRRIVVTALVIAQRVGVCMGVPQRGNALGLCSVTHGTGICFYAVFRFSRLGRDFTIVPVVRCQARLFICVLAAGCMPVVRIVRRPPVSKGVRVRVVPTGQ